MDETLIIGVTGQTGAGKTTISNEFKKYGCAVIDADVVSREVLSKNKECINRLKNEFGSDISENGVINRRLLASRAFSNEHNVLKLNEITHPYIVKEILSLINEFKTNGNDIIIIDAPLLFEAGLDKICNRVIAAVAPLEVRVERIRRRDNLTQQEAIARISAQKEDDFYMSRADYIIDGQQNKECLKSKIKELISDLVEGKNV